MRVFFIISFAVIFLGFADSTIVGPCKDGGVIPPGVNLESDSKICKESPCIAYTGSSCYFNVNFTSPGYVPSITPKYKATSMGVTLDYPCEKDACTGITNTVCPLVENERVSYTWTLSLPSFYPECLVDLEVSFTNDDDNSRIFCFTTQIDVRHK
ncbi:NPC intracellular cholesterol transporter 2 [Diabrotica virgifera virgifera]|uniref:NPC intracellular cholesterol transporter 2-like n=1 Tax=Diabrotica virgifera virgifera TaxID=50390 RepID=A0A6P7GFV6_DIAVI|nr:NPC intracellular cholesterol transporter 2 [Diabrotica virgifera virgifera]